MKYGWSGFLLLFASAIIAHAQITKTATFENFAPGQNLGYAFTDPLSGIAFSDSTAGTELFGVGSGLAAFGGGNYLSMGPGAGLGGFFAFTANLPAAADYASVEVAYVGGNSSTIVLTGYSGPNATGTIISQQSLANAPDPFTLQITSSQYNIESIQTAAGASTGYDNISYTYLPEPSALLGILGIVTLHRGMQTPMSQRRVGQ